MLNRNYFYSIALIVLLCGCGRPKPQQQNGYDPGREIPLMQRVELIPAVLDIENADLVDYDMLVDELIYIPLGREQGPLGTIKDIIYHDGRFYIQDEGQDQVFIFDQTGKNIRKISAKGRGPKEYLGIANIDIDPDKNELIIQDGLSGRSLYYDLDGNYKHSFEIPFENTGMLCLNDSILLYLIETHQNRGSNELARWGLVAMLGDSLVAKAFKFLPSQIGYYGVRDNLRRGYDKTYYRHLYSDSIYAINSDLTYSLAYYAKFKNSVWKKYYQSEKFELMQEKGKGEWMYPWFYETKDFFLGSTNVTGSKKMDYVIYDRQKGVTHIAKMKEYNEMNELNRFWGFSCLGAGEGYFVFACDAIVFEDATGIKKGMKNGTLKITDPNLERIIKGIDVNDNPILILTKLKSI